MAHFAKLDENNVVVSVHVVKNDVLDNGGSEDAQKGIDFLNQLHGNATWIQASYNKNIRKNYPGVGFTYDSTRDAFIPPKPYESWTLNEDSCHWQPPTPCPSYDGNVYIWNEETTAWELQ